MSVNMELVPVVIAMKKSMGEDNFQKWIASMQIRVPTKFKDKTELKKSIQKGGYDAQDWGSSIKTHIDGERIFFFWDIIEGFWTAIFAKSDPQTMIKKFMDEIEEKNKTKIFSSVPQLKRKPFLKTFEYPTDFKDKKLLIKTLKEYGVNPTVNSNGDITINLEGFQFRFYQINQEPFNVEIKTPEDSKKIFDHLSLIDEDYKNNVQSYTYENLKKNIEKRSLFIESEEVLDDDSIVITLNIDNFHNKQFD